ncbi:hypothetical protein FWK35_00019308, partial [Aphis craccivora]
SGNDNVVVYRGPAIYYVSYTLHNAVVLKGSIKLNIYTVLDRDNGLQSAQSYVIHYKRKLYNIFMYNGHQIMDMDVCTDRKGHNTRTAYDDNSTVVHSVRTAASIRQCNGGITTILVFRWTGYSFRDKRIGSKIFLGIFYSRYNNPRSSLTGVEVS